MHPTHAPWVRAFLERKFIAVRLWLSTVRDPPELEALRALSDPKVVTEIIDFTMAKLGYVPKNAVQGLRPADHPEGSRRVRELRKRLAQPRGVERETEAV